MGAADLPEDIYELSCLLFQARKWDARGKQYQVDFPSRKNYFHNPICEFDFCIAQVKALLAEYNLTKKVKP